jgi:uncharacterized protein DUF1569
MKSLRNQADRDEILRRLEQLRPDSARRWGCMTSHQMICHLSDGVRLYLGERPAAPARVPYSKTILKWVALWAPLPWPHGFQTMPELDQHGGGGTPPEEFASDVEELRSLTERFAKTPKDFAWGQHPHFGAMKYHEWMRLAYLHADHHLRQFGV